MHKHIWYFNWFIGWIQNYNFSCKLADKWLSLQLEALVFQIQSKVMVLIFTVTQHPLLQASLKDYTNFSPVFSSNYMSSCIPNKGNKMFLFFSFNFCDKNVDCWNSWINYGHCNICEGCGRSVLYCDQMENMKYGKIIWNHHRTLYRT